MTTKLLIVDDSALMRRHLTQIFEAAGGFAIRTARDGLDALREVREFGPDVVTLDLNMPQMDGMTCLSHLMVEHPVPVVMLSSLTQKDTLATLEALALGAVDYVAKPGGTVSLDMRTVSDELVRKVRDAARSRVRRAKGVSTRMQKDATGPTARSAERPAARLVATGKVVEQSDDRIVLVGVSTGGPRTLEELLPKLPEDFPYAVLVSIHMPGVFTSYFTQRMADLCAMPVEEVNRQTAIVPGRIYIAKGDTDMLVSRRAGKLVALPAPPDPQQLWHPSVERMVASAVDHVSAKSLIAVQLTGMGYDGGAAMTRLRQKGGHTIAESEQTAVVFGMPKDLIERGGAEVVLPVEKIAPQLLAWAQRTE